MIDWCPQTSFSTNLTLSLLKKKRAVPQWQVQKLASKNTKKKDKNINCKNNIRTKLDGRMKNNGEQWTTYQWSNVYKEREEAKGSEMAQGQREPCERDQEKSYKGENFLTLTKRSQVISDIQKHSQEIRMILNLAHPKSWLIGGHGLGIFHLFPRNSYT